MYLLHAELKARPEAVADVQRHLESALQLAGTEPGNIHFAYFSPGGHPEQFLVQELYRSKEDCDLHLASPLVQGILQSFGALLLEPPRIVFGELINGRFRQPEQPDRKC